MKRKVLPVLFVCVLFSATAEVAVVELGPFRASAEVGDYERKAVEDLVQSYVAELDGFSIAVPGESKEHGFRLSGNIGATGEDRVLTLEAVDLKTGEKKNVSSIYRGVNDLALEMRTLIRRLFETAEKIPTEEAKRWTAHLNENVLSGSWIGDKGVEVVRVFKDGKAKAVLSSGVQMELAYAIAGDEVTFTQTSPNTARFYHPVPYAVALELTKSAQPMEWRFKLTEDGSALQGTKTATAVSYEGDTVKSVVRDAKRNAEWRRAIR